MRRRKGIRELIRECAPRLGVDRRPPHDAMRRPEAQVLVLCLARAATLLASTASDFRSRPTGTPGFRFALLPAGCGALGELRAAGITIPALVRVRRDLALYQELGELASLGFALESHPGPPADRGSVTRLTGRPRWRSPAWSRCRRAGAAGCRARIRCGGSRSPRNARELPDHGTRPAGRASERASGDCRASSSAAETSRRETSETSCGGETPLPKSRIKLGNPAHRPLGDGSHSGARASTRAGWFP